MRLAKFLAGAGVASRRRAEKIISEGRVRVNDVTVRQPQYRVEAEDTVTVDGRRVEGFEEKRYVLLNKPAGYISTASDTHNRPTVIDLVSDINTRLYPVGRLDADTSGVLLLTNDGELAYRLTHPRFEIKKVYRARVKGRPSYNAIKKLQTGLLVDGEKTAPAEVELLEEAGSGSSSVLEITLIEGKKRQVKKMCRAVGHPVQKLHRVKFAGLTLGSLEEGAYRHLGKEEIDRLYSLVDL